jgi:hypothetical protein
MKMFAKMKFYNPYEAERYAGRGYQEVVRTYTARYPSGVKEILVFADGEKRKADYCEICYVF